MLDHLPHREFLFDPRNVGCSSRLNKFDSFLRVRIGVCRPKTDWQGLRAVHLQNYTASHIGLPCPTSAHSARKNSWASLKQKNNSGISMIPLKRRLLLKQNYWGLLFRSPITSFHLGESIMLLFCVINRLLDSIPAHSDTYQSAGTHLIAASAGTQHR